jgi:hypothetical protein
LICLAPERYTWEMFTRQLTSLCFPIC